MQPTSTLPITSKEAVAGDPRRQPTLPGSQAKRPATGTEPRLDPRAASPAQPSRGPRALGLERGAPAHAVGRRAPVRRRAAASALLVPGGWCSESAFDLAGPATARRVRGGQTRPAAAACSTCTLPAGLSPQVVGSPRARGRTTPHTARGGETLGAENGKGTPYLGNVGCGLAKRTLVRGAGSPLSVWGGENRLGRAS